MYYYGSGAEGLILFFMFAITIAVLVAWLMAINLFAKIARAKGYYKDGAGILWFIGIFATPIVVGIYVAALPDKRQAGTLTQGGVPVGVDDELPSI